MSIRDNLGGGGSAGSVLDTLEEIEANTEAGKAAGALAVKELNDSLGECIKKYKLIKTVTTIAYSDVYYYDLDISEITENALTDGISIVSSINNTTSDGAAFMYGKTLSNTKIRCFFNGSLSNASITFNIIK